MGKVEDFINGLDGKSDLAVTEVVSELLKLHNEEIGTANAKIDSLNDTVAARDSEITGFKNEIKEVKSANWDLVNRIPAANADQESNNDSDQSVKTGMDQFFKDE